MTTKKQKPSAAVIAKCPTGIAGLDEITGGGLPCGRPTLVCGSAGCGKTLLGAEFLVRGILQYQEPGVLLTFEETSEELTNNVRSLGFDLDELVRQKQLVIDYVRIERSEIDETGEYDLEGLFIRLGHAIDSIGAKRVVLDTLETLFSGLSNTAILRAELRRLFRWLKDKGVTAVITAERGDGTFTRHGLEEYVSDCVILLDHRIVDQVSTRRLRVLKYRGSHHGANEYPFLINETGISVLPITSAGLHHEASTKRISTGIARLDEMLGGRGFFVGSSILVSGTAGTGKTSIACHAAAACCQRNERCLYLAFEESSSQLIRNMKSIDLDLAPYVEKGLLQIQCARPTMHGLEWHLAAIHKSVAEINPQFVVIDPISNFMTVGSNYEVEMMLVRVIDFLKARQTTALLTNLTHQTQGLEETQSRISSLIDTWLLLRDIESNGERNRGLFVLKSRGMAHSNQIREFRLTSQGIDLVDVYLGPQGVLTGSARLAQEASDQASNLLRDQEIAWKRRELERKENALEAQIASLRLQFELEKDDLELAIAEHETRQGRLEQNRQEMAHIRKADSHTGAPRSKGNRK